MTNVIKLPEHTMEIKLPGDWFQCALSMHTITFRAPTGTEANGKMAEYLEETILFLQEMLEDVKGVDDE